MAISRANVNITAHISIYLCLLFCSSVLAEAIPQSEDDSKTIQFGVLPFLAPARLESMYAPVASALGQLLNKKVYLKTGTSSGDYFKQLEKQVFDIAIVNPFDSVAVIDEFNYVPLTARPKHHCIIVTAESSSIDSVEGLRGKVVGLASKRSPISFYSLRAIESDGLKAGKDFTVKYHKTAQACLHNLVIGNIDACGAGGVTSSIFKNKRKIDLKKIKQCEAFPGMVIVVHFRIPQQQREDIKKLILGWRKSGNSSILKKLGKHAKFIPYDDDDYKLIRRHRRQWQQYSHDVP